MSQSCYFIEFLSIKYALHIYYEQISAMINLNMNVTKLFNMFANCILKISKSARAFIEKEHNYILSAKKYLETWSKV